MSRILTFIIITFLFHTTLSAAHIVGGDVTYKCIESNPITKTTKFTVTFTIYRDANSGGAFLIIMLHLVFFSKKYER
ncbi:MAG: hypothetical protein IPO26_13570 [Saprospiraceae bacterium]|nr:hypothetical protein [Saprospiraceae bacterium]